MCDRLNCYVYYYCALSTPFHPSTPPPRSQHEIKMALRRFWGIELTAAEAQSIMTIYDADGNNTLDIDEFRCMLKNVSTES